MKKKYKNETIYLRGQPFIKYPVTIFWNYKILKTHLQQEDEKPNKKSQRFKKMGIIDEII